MAAAAAEAAAVRPASPAGEDPAGAPPAWVERSAALEDAWAGHRSALLRYVRRRVADDAAAEDLVHDVLLRAYAQRGQLRGRLEPWLYRIAHNALVDHYRARRPAEPLPEDLAAPEADAPGAAAELAGCLAPLVQRLPARDREALTLADVEGVRQREAAARLGLSLSGAKSRVQRARARLRELLLECCRVELDVRGHPRDYVRSGECPPLPTAGAPCGAACAPRREAP